MILFLVVSAMAGRRFKKLVGASGATGEAGATGATGAASRTP
jgi:hypothetical protein